MKAPGKHKNQVALVLISTMSFLLSCSPANNPNQIAKEWLYAYSQGNEYQISLLTCTPLQEQAVESMENYHKHHFDSIPPTEIDLSQVQFHTIRQETDFAGVNTVGKAVIWSDTNSITSTFNHNWYFILENDEWRWCGNYNPDPPPITIPVIVISIIFIFFIIITSKRRADTTYSKDYYLGHISDVNKLRGTRRIVDHATNKKYNAASSSVIVGKSDNLTNGEEVLFQISWKSSNKSYTATNIIRLEYPPKNQSRFSTWVIKLAKRTKTMLNSSRFLQIVMAKSAEKELNECKAFLQQLNDHAQRHAIYMETYERVLIANIETDLETIKSNIETTHLLDDSTLLRRIIRIIFQSLDILAELISFISPETATLLKIINKGTKRLLAGKITPLLPSGDEEDD
jgi:hypothetical protein